MSPGSKCGLDLLGPGGLVGRRGAGPLTRLAPHTSGRQAEAGVVPASWGE